VLGEDCALLWQDRSVGRRGMCGMVFIFKVNLKIIAKDKCGLLHNWKAILNIIFGETWGIYGGQSQRGEDFLWVLGFAPVKYQSPSARYSYFIHLPSMLCNLSR
jgi:hypothetical protein